MQKVWTQVPIINVDFNVMKEIHSGFEHPESFSKFGITKDNYLSHDGYPVTNFAELRKLIAELSCLNPDSILFFRGQHTDHRRPYGKMGEASTFLPSIFRGKLRKGDLIEKWNKLELATNLLIDKLKTIPEARKKEFNFLKAKRLAQWSVLQHYEVVDTPLLDVTQSLRVACSFAELGRTSDTAYIYVFALPYPTGRISINSEQYITNIRLLSVVPSCVRRPHNQEGFLIGEDDMVKTDSVSDRFDFRRRSIAKFKLDLREGSGFWEDCGLTERPLTEQELYPDKSDDSDTLGQICKDIKESLAHFSSTILEKEDKTSIFLDQWRKIEKYLLGYQREMWHDFKPSVPKALITMKNHNKADNDEDVSVLISKIYELRNMRNSLVHTGGESVNIDQMLYLATWTIENLEKKIPGISAMADYWQKEYTLSQTNSK